MAGAGVKSMLWGFFGIMGMIFKPQGAGTGVFRAVLGAILLWGGMAWSQDPAADPNSPQNVAAYGKYFLEGYEKEAKGDFAAAYALYTKAHDLRDESPALLIRRAYCGAKIGQTREVAMDLKRAFELQPKTMTDYSTMAWFYATSPFDAFRDGARAVTLGKKMMNTEPSADAYDILAAGYAEMGNFSEAKDLLMKGIKFYPTSPRVPEMKERLALYGQKKKFREVWLDEPEGDKKPEKKGWF
jgi:tetratricopeptide (TPR) repeat protein